MSSRTILFLYFGKHCNHKANTLMPETALQLLHRHIEEITPLSDTDFTRIAEHFTFKKLRKHQFLVQEGDHTAHEYWVVSGCLKSSYADADGKEHILQFAPEGWWIADFPAYFRQQPATLTIDCLESAEVLALSLASREALCKEFRVMEHFFRRKLTSGFVSLQERVLSMQRLSAAERYAQFLALYPNLLQRVPKRLVASYIGVSRETLSRL
jgi:CRP-like cAMP-binding protein